MELGACKVSDGNLKVAIATRKDTLPRTGFGAWTSQVGRGKRTQWSNNLSAGGLYVRLKRSVEKEAQLVVLRTEPQSDGSCGVALDFTRQRLLKRIL